MEAAYREAFEEVGVLATELKEVFSLIDGEGNTHHFFLCSNWNGQIVNNEPDLCGEVGWFTVARLPSNCTDITYEAVMNLGNL